MDLAPGQDYDVAVGFDLGTPDTPGTAPWTLIAGAYPQEPEGTAGITFRDGTTPDSVGTGAVTWVEKSYELTVRASPDGKAVVILGVWGGPRRNARTTWTTCASSSPAGSRSRGRTGQRHRVFHVDAG